MPLKVCVVEPAVAKGHVPHDRSTNAANDKAEPRGIDVLHEYVFY